MVVSNGIAEARPCGNSRASSSILALTAFSHLSALAPGSWKIADAGRRLAVEREDLAVGLRAELDPADIAQARDLAVGAGLDDDVLELARRR